MHFAAFLFSGSLKQLVDDCEKQKLRKKTRIPQKKDLGGHLRRRNKTWLWTNVRENANLWPIYNNL